MSQTTTNKHLVLGAGGAQGAAIARELVKQGEKVRGIGRFINDSVPDGVEKMAADLADPASLDKAFKGVTHVTVTIPLVYDPAIVNSYAHNIANAAVKAGVKRIVFNANTRTPTEMTGIAAFDTRADAEKVLRASGIPTITLQPAIYLENLLAPPVMAGMKEKGELYYPLPADMRVSWISHDDLAKAVYAAHQMDTIPELPIAIGSGPVSGKELAEELSDALGRSLSFIPLDPKIFEGMLAEFLGPDVAAGVAGVYHWAFGHPQSTAFSYGAVDQKEKLGITAHTPQEWSVRQPWAVMTTT